MPKIKENSNEVSKNIVNKLWRETPPGPEQKELNRLFATGIITDDDTPNMIRQKFTIFKDITPRVFGVHFRKTKEKYAASKI